MVKVTPQWIKKLVSITVTLTPAQALDIINNRKLQQIIPEVVNAIKEVMQHDYDSFPPQENFPPITESSDRMCGGNCNVYTPQDTIKSPGGTIIKYRCCVCLWTNDAGTNVWRQPD